MPITDFVEAQAPCYRVTLGLFSGAEYVAAFKRMPMPVSLNGEAERIFADPSFSRAEPGTEVELVLTSGRALGVRARSLSLDYLSQVARARDLRAGPPESIPAFVREHGAGLPAGVYTFACRVRRGERSFLFNVTRCEEGIFLCAVDVPVPVSFDAGRILILEAVRRLR